MKFALLADLHGNLPATLPACDAVIIAGDVCPDNKYTLRDNTRCAIEQATWLAGPFTTWVKEDVGVPVFLIWGNHDFIGETELGQDLHWLPVIDLNDKPVRWKGVTLFGCPWTGGLPKWAMQWGPYAQQASEYWSYVPDDVTVLVTHGPPYTFGDRLLTGEHVGDKPVLGYRQRVQPKLHVCGHIHEARGVYGPNQNIYNVAYVDAQYRPWPQPIPVVEVTP